MSSSSSSSSDNKMDNYEVLNSVGKGTFGVVNKIKRKADGKIMVWKEMDYGKMSEKEKELLVSEVNILREFHHPNIVRYYDRIIDRENTKIYIIMEYCEGGDLASYIKKCKRNNSYIDEETIWKLFSQIVVALNECHNRKNGKILHRDLKPGNIFFDSKRNVKLGDFGLSRVLNDGSMFAHTYVGTPFYMSPEQINESAYNEKSDIWSLGCLIYELCALCPPFDAQNHLTLAVKIKSGRFSRIPSHYSSALYEVICKMLQVSQSRRPSVSELMRHPYIAFNIRERTLNSQVLAMRRKEEDLSRRESDLKIRESEIRSLERKLREKEAQLDQRQSSLDNKERRLNEMLRNGHSNANVDETSNNTSNSSNSNNNNLNTINNSNGHSSVISAGSISSDDSSFSTDFMTDSFETIDVRDNESSSASYGSESSVASKEEKENENDNNSNSNNNSNGGDRRTTASDYYSAKLAALDASLEIPEYGNGTQMGTQKSNDTTSNEPSSTTLTSTSSSNNLITIGKKKSSTLLGNAIPPTGLQGPQKPMSRRTSAIDPSTLLRDYSRYDSSANTTTSNQYVPKLSKQSSTPNLVANMYSNPKISSSKQQKQQHSINATKLNDYLGRMKRASSIPNLNKGQYGL